MMKNARLDTIVLVLSLPSYRFLLEALLACAPEINAKTKI
jgi:hypothetical protein